MEGQYGPVQGGSSLWFGLINVNYVSSSKGSYLAHDVIQTGTWIMGGSANSFSLIHLLNWTILSGLFYVLLRKKRWNNDNNWNFGKQMRLEPEMFGSVNVLLLLWSFWGLFFLYYCSAGLAVFSSLLCSFNLALLLNFFFCPSCFWIIFSFLGLFPI